MKAFRTATFGLAAVLLLVSWGNTAFGVVFGNPSPRFDQGDVGLGFRTSDYRKTVFLDYGITDDGTLQILAGEVDVTTKEGTEYGVGYRQKIGDPIEMEVGSLGFGVFGFFRHGEADERDINAEFQLYDAGVGAGLKIAEPISVFAAAVIRYIELRNAPDKADRNYKPEVDVGGAVGVEFWLWSTLLLGAEQHFGLKDDHLGLYVEVKF